MDSKAECDQLYLAHVSRKKTIKRSNLRNQFEVDTMNDFFNVKNSVCDTASQSTEPVSMVIVSAWSVCGSEWSV